MSGSSLRDAEDILTVAKVKQTPVEDCLPEKL